MGRDVNMNSPKNRKYVSPGREQKAATTRGRILDAAEVLLLEKGFAGMTVAELARRSGVSPQTVYAVFGSKAGIIMAAIENKVLQDARNLDVVKRLQTMPDPVLALKSLARLVRVVSERSAPSSANVYKACVVSPQLAELENEIDELRLERLTPVAARLVASGRLLPGLNEETVRDILWTLTSRDIYYLFVLRRGWSPDKYERQLYSLLAASLLRPDSPASG
ncbi:MAG: TetR/AcrR family transcriptional regulator [Deltaproteobacteria bacterium]|jgi:AcrR family transcriptional regulator|nr:TetR/AcrR family transcriptional regulator [Deltaproteobacteria bacterium]